MTMNRDQFEREFHSRTLAYQPVFRRDDRGLIIAVGPDAHSPAGHALLLTLVNQLARLHRRLVIVGDVDQPLLCRDVLGLNTVVGATVGLARQINPFLDVKARDTRPSSATDLVLGVGQARGVDLSIGCRGWEAVLGPTARIYEEPESIWGALLAACLATNVVFLDMCGLPARLSGSYSLWHRVRSTQVPGPHIAGPIDVGRVLQVGAGAVGCALDFFLGFVGVVGKWTIVDGDEVDVSNLNRQLLYRARDAGFPDGSRGKKAEVTARLLGPSAVSSSQWYGEDPQVVQAKYDLVLALANERMVRPALQHRQPTVLLHATTSRGGQAQLHRHVAGRDDCIACRLPASIPHTACATSPGATEAGAKFDAAVPQLSSLAGLLLAAELVRLQEGLLVKAPHNFVAIDLRQADPIVQEKIFSCREGCSVRLPAARRAAVDADSRFQLLDPDSRTVAE